MGADDTPLDAHLRDLEDGCGCTEVWEHTSAAREAERADDSETDDASADEADAADAGTEQSD